MPFEEAPSMPPFLHSEMPFHRRAYRLEKGRDKGRLLHFVDHGHRDGQIVVFFHGNPTWSFLWRKVINALDHDRFRCLAPDLLGLGLSDKWPEVSDHTLERHQAVLCEWFAALELKNVILVGQDWGGPMVTGVGAAFSEHIRGVVLGNTSILVPRRPRGTAFHRFSHTPLLSDLVFRGLGFPLQVLHRTQGDPASIRGQVAKAYRWPLQRIKDRAAPLALARMVPNSPEHPTILPLKRGEEWLRSFEGPLELVWGEKDPILGRALKRHIEVLPKAQVTRTQAGHFLQEEVPDKLAEAIVRVTELLS
jgi:haloalkane dehalogenase